MHQICDFIKPLGTILDNQTKMNTEGDIYKGDLKDGLPHGFGKVNYNDGDCY